MCAALSTGTGAFKCCKMAALITVKLNWNRAGGMKALIRMSAIWEDGGHIIKTSVSLYNDFSEMLECQCPCLPSHPVPKVNPDN